MMKGKNKGFTPLHPESLSLKTGVEWSGRCVTGFTLIEILVALAILGIVLAGIYSVYRMQHKSYIVQEQVAEMQQNERIALQMITRDLKMAGLGLSTAPYLSIVVSEDINGNGGTPDAGEDINGNGAIDAYDGFGNDNSDILRIAYFVSNPNSKDNGGKTTLDRNSSILPFTPTSSVTLPVDPGIGTFGFAPGDLVLVSAPKSAGSEVFTGVPGNEEFHYALICITSVVPPNLQHIPGEGSTPCANKKNFEYMSDNISGFDGKFKINVTRVNPREGNSSGEGGNIVYAINETYQLTRSIDGADPQPLADNIEDMQIAYGIDINDDKIVGDAEWFDDPTINPNYPTIMEKLREIRVTLVARTTREDPAYNVGTRPIVENHDPAGSVVTTPAQAARYRRRVLQSTIKLRNIDEIYAQF